MIELNYNPETNAIDFTDTNYETIPAKRRFSISACIETPIGVKFIFSSRRCEMVYQGKEFNTITTPETIERIRMVLERIPEATIVYGFKSYLNYYDQKLNIDFKFEDIYLENDEQICFYKHPMLYIYEFKLFEVGKFIRSFNIDMPIPRLFQAISHGDVYVVGIDNIKIYRYETQQLIEEIPITKYDRDRWYKIIEELSADVFIEFIQIDTYFNGEYIEIRTGDVFTINDFVKENPEHTEITFERDNKYYTYTITYTELFDMNDIDPTTLKITDDYIGRFGFYYKPHEIFLNREDIVFEDEKRITFAKNNRRYDFPLEIFKQIVNEEREKYKNIVGDGFYDPETGLNFTVKDVICLNQNDTVISFYWNERKHDRKVKKVAKLRNPMPKLSPIEQLEDDDQAREEYLDACFHEILRNWHPTYYKEEQIGFNIQFYYKLDDGNNLVLECNYDVIYKWRQSQYYDTDVRYILKLHHTRWMENYTHRGFNIDVLAEYHPSVVEFKYRLKEHPLKSNTEIDESDSPKSTVPTDKKITETKPNEGKAMCDIDEILRQCGGFAP
jgi:hypothetical protein